MGGGETSAVSNPLEEQTDDLSVHVDVPLDQNNRTCGTNDVVDFGVCVDITHGRPITCIRRNERRSR